MNHSTTIYSVPVLTGNSHRTALRNMFSTSYNVPEDSDCKFHKDRGHNTISFLATKNLTHSWNSINVAVWLPRTTQFCFRDKSYMSMSCVSVIIKKELLFKKINTGTRASLQCALQNCHPSKLSLSTYSKTTFHTKRIGFKSLGQQQIIIWR